MKKQILAFILILSLSLAFAGCGKKGTAEAKVGDTLSAPEKTVSFEDFDKITITLNAENFKENITFNHTLSIQNSNDTLKLFRKTNFTNHTAGNMTSCELGISRDDSFTVYTSVNDSEWSVRTDADSTQREQLYSAFANCGFDYSDYMKNAEFVKQEDATVNGFDCYVYETELDYGVSLN